MPLIARCDNCNKELPVEIDPPMNHNRRYVLTTERNYHLRFSGGPKNHFVACSHACGLAIDQADKHRVLPSGTGLE